MAALQPYGSALELRRHNSALDAVLRDLAQAVPERYLHDEFSDEDARTLAEQLGHLAEFPAYFARQIDDWVDRRRIVVGRVARHDPDHHDALERATGRRLAPLLAELDDALARMDRALGRLCDDHLTATVHDVTREREPLISFLERYVIGHKAAHRDELRTWIDHANG